jgi:hypothetical protein
MVYHLIFLNMFVLFMTGSFLIVGSEEADPFPGPLILQMGLLWIYGGL